MHPIALSVPTVVPSAVLAEQPWIGITCPALPGPFNAAAAIRRVLTCDRVGLSIDLRTPAVTATATINGPSFKLDNRSWSDLPVAGKHKYLASFTAELGGPDYIQHDFERQVTELFTSNGIPYHFNEEGRLVPTMSPAVVAVAIEPALEALNEPALATAYEHFLQALKRLAEPDPDEAVDEGRQAVEAAMLALVDACGLERPRQRTAQRLFDALAPTECNAPRAMSRDAEELVLATPRFRNKTSAGHSGGSPVGPLTPVNTLGHHRLLVQRDARQPFPQARTTVGFIDTIVTQLERIS